ncbi:FAD/FMN-containing dehydrogenase [Streptoalloteichus tenebrarius]|uniref:FAD/FMN-containing dehydrogenase n=1 Tax=Streptoalloteichus tenebrarius (strain ATCC 17920 / DSM 40477 / JCM 4838 / CBS 697.72 / NBRC 16177 / NCIMB 11028 / NRRL B-12390 / A12253. 1 / ISP 5477) TaxID=1933 RepID=A0ABT1HXE3_STRSD|nr:FAD-binding protein [Streptoalloteichus tenebrarius]MCP2260166.1 FAD/FMN-containing dehydrogenase [Streptoalloteichus tenebrarius]
MSPEDWAALRRQLTGRLILPGEPGYDLLCRPFNALCDDRVPAAIVRCAGPEDVRRCLDLAAGSGTPVAARSGGHSYPAYSTPRDGLVVDLRDLADVEVRADGVAVVGAGTRLVEVATALAGAGRCLPLGSCPTVGLAGLTLGGGIGMLDRAFGLTADRLRSARVVLPDGRLVTASPDSEPDLFWALRGGGGGNFGVVVSFEFATEAAPDLAVFAMDFPAGSAVEVFGGWQEWITRVPSRMWANCTLTGGAAVGCRVVGCWVGGPDAGRSLLAELVRSVGTSPGQGMFRAADFLTATRHFAGCSEIPPACCRLRDEGGVLPRVGFVASSRVLTRPVGAAALVGLLEGSEGVVVEVDPLGGVIAEVDAAATAFPHRSAFATAQVYATATAEDRVHRTRLVFEVQRGLAELGATGAYINYLDPGQSDWATASYGPNLGRLREIARRYDPDAVLGFPQGLA